MKKLVVLFVIGLLTMSTGFEKGIPDLVREIEKKVIVDLSNVELSEVHPEYVIINFKIVNGQINIQGINGTSEELKEIITKELYEIHIDSEYSEDKSYIYRFTFEKI